MALRDWTKRLPTGAWIFFLIFGWLMVQLIGVTLWSLWTYPAVDDLDALSGLDDEARLQGLLELRREWLDQIVTIGTGLAVTPMTALLSAVVGYLLRGMKDDAGADVPG